MATACDENKPWWVEAWPEGSVASRERDRAFWEFAQFRAAPRSAMDSRADWGHRLMGQEGDCAHWIWAFEMRESERILFRPMGAGMILERLSHFERLSQSLLGGCRRLGQAALEPEGASSREAERAAALALNVAQAARIKDAPFEAGEEGRAHWAKRAWDWSRGARFDRRPFFDRLARTYPELAAMGFFDGFQGATARGALEAKRHLLMEPAARKAVAAGMAPPVAEPSDGALALRVALAGGPPAMAPWPSARLMAWSQSRALEACALEGVEKGGRKKRL